MVALTGVAAGLFGDLMMLILFSVQDVAFGAPEGASLAAAVAQASGLRRIVVLLAARAFGGIRVVPAAPPDAWGEDRDRRFRLGKGARLSFR
jgi:hypothetical protein